MPKTSTTTTRWTAATVFLLAMCLRPPFTAVGPVLERIGADERLGEGAQGVLGAIPLLAFGLVSPLVHRLASRFGAERAVAGSLLVLLWGTLVRSWAGSTGLWVGTGVIGAAIAVGNVLAPTFVKRDYAHRVSAAMGTYTAFITGTAAVASALIVPLSNLVGWRVALAVWAVPILVVTLIWLPRTRSGPAAAASATGGTIWRWPTAWLVTAFMGLQSTTFYIMVTWLPTIEGDHGVSEEVAGLHLFVMQGAGILGGLMIPLLMRGSSLTLASVVATVPMIVAAVGILLVPSLFLLWALSCGLATGAALVVALALIGLRSRTEPEATRLSGMAQSLGYLLATAGPIAAGYLAEYTHRWNSTLLTVVGLAALQILVGIRVGADRT